MPTFLPYSLRFALGVVVAFTCAWLGVTSPVVAKDFEVWLVDQSDSFGKAYGGALYIFEGADVSGKAASSAVPTHKIDLGDDDPDEGTAGLCSSQTGAPPVRPHMLFFNSTHRHAILSFVTSGHVVIFDAATRRPIKCLRMSPGATNPVTGLPFIQAHAAFPAPDDAFILVANQNGKLLERINSNADVTDPPYAGAHDFVHDPAATLNLLTCTTPNDVPCEVAGVRPNNAPICPIIDSSSHLGFVTLAGGGLFVVNPRTTPIQILAEYTIGTVHGNGCGGLEARGSMYINSGAGTAAGNASEFDVYQFPLTGYDASNLPDTPAPLGVFSDDANPLNRDSHGSVVTKHERYLWVFDRGLNVVEVFDTTTDLAEPVNTITLAGTSSEDPAPDLADIAPAGNRIFVSLRGPNPLSGSPHVATGSTPGLGVIQVKQGGKSGALASVIPIHNVDAAGVERADAHGIRVRVKAGSVKPRKWGR